MVYPFSNAVAERENKIDARLFPLSNYKNRQDAKDAKTSKRRKPRNTGKRQRLSTFCVFFLFLASFASWLFVGFTGTIDREGRSSLECLFRLLPASVRRRGRAADHEAKGQPLILLAFFFPVAIYLIVLGLVNRSRHPLPISGIWDGIFLLFGVSGFLLFAGPAVLSGLSERWRLFWLLGKGDAPLAEPRGAWQFWIFLSFLYFVLIVGGTAYYLWRQRRFTAIYNADAEQIEHVVSEICEQLEVHPVRSGGLFVFGLSLGKSPERRAVVGEPLQAPHLGITTVSAPHEPLPIASDRILSEQTAILEVEDFPLMRHVTLRWDPAASPLRQTMETELRRRLVEATAYDHALGSWLLTLGSTLLAAEFAGALLVLALRLFVR
jgi:hypothetical protein